MIGGFPNTIYGRPGRDEEIEKVRQSIQAAGQVGLPVVEYNFYAHRAMEGYYEETGRGGAGLTGVDYDRMKGLPPLPDEGAHTLDEMWANITYFLKAVIPVAEKANVRLALHPNDPPFPLSRGSQQIMATLAGWKHLIEIVDSPSNGITFDCGVTREMGEDPVAVCRYFGSRDRINHMHYRNPHVMKPYLKYDEGFIDEGDVNHVRGDARAGQGEVFAGALPGTSARPRLRPRARTDSRLSRWRRLRRGSLRHRLREGHAAGGAYRGENRGLSQRELDREKAKTSGRPAKCG